MPGRAAWRRNIRCKKTQEIIVETQGVSDFFFCLGGGYSNDSSGISLAGSIVFD